MQFNHVANRVNSRHSDIVVDMFVQQLGFVELRRTERAAQPADVIRSGGLAIDVPRMRVTVGERPVDLTPTEFQLLAALAREPGRVLTRSQLLDAIRGTAFESYERAIDAHVKNVRKKIESDPREPRYIVTVYGVGYRFADGDG